MCWLDARGLLIRRDRPTHVGSEPRVGPREVIPDNPVLDRPLLQQDAGHPVPEQLRDGIGAGCPCDRHRGEAGEHGREQASRI